MKRRRSYNAETPSSLSSDFSATEISPSPTIECFFNDHTYEDDIDDLNVAPCKDDPTQTCCQSDANFCYVTALHFIDDPCYPICWNSTIKDSGSPELDGKPMIYGGCVLKRYDHEAVCGGIGDYMKCCQGEHCNNQTFKENYIQNDLTFNGRACGEVHNTYFKENYPGIEMDAEFSHGRFVIIESDSKKEVMVGPTCSQMKEHGYDYTGLRLVDDGWGMFAFLPGIVMLSLLFGLVGLFYNRHRKKFNCYGNEMNTAGLHLGSASGEAMLPVDLHFNENDSTPTNVSESDQQNCKEFDGKNNQQNSQNSQNSQNLQNQQNQQNQHNQQNKQSQQNQQIDLNNEQNPYNINQNQHTNQSPTNLDISEGTTQVTDLSYYDSTAPLLSGRGPPNINLPQSENQFNSKNSEFQNSEFQNSEFQLIQHQIKRDLSMENQGIENLENQLSAYQNNISSQLNTPQPFSPTFSPLQQNTENSVISAAPPVAGIRPEDLFKNCQNNELDFENSLLDSICPSTGRGPAELELRKVTMNIKRGEIIGQGRFGRVYRAVDNMNRSLAVKVIYSKDEQQYQIEATIMKYGLLNHPNIVNFFMADRVDTGAFTELWLVTEYYRHNSLYDYLNRERSTPHNLTDEQVAFFAQSVATGLAFIHSEEHLSDMSRPKIAHRDLKSKNILIKDDQQSCVIADFGLAVSYSSKTQKLLGVENGKIAGTVRYLAPEILFDESIDCLDFSTYERADMYCLSLVIWEILTCSGKTGDYQLPYDEYTSRDPTLDDMRNALGSTGFVDNGAGGVAVGDVALGHRIGIKSGVNRPSVAKEWRENFEEVVECMEECWNAIPASRPTSLNVMKNLNRFVERKKYVKK